MGRGKAGITRLCSMPICNDKIVARNLCSKHLQKHYRGTLVKEMFSYTFECEFGEEHSYRSDCACSRVHHQSTGTHRGQGRHPVREDGVIGYEAMHRRLTKARGRAKDYNCVVTTEGLHQASEWALKVGYGTQQQERNGRTYEYDTDIDSYQPMCRSHHRKMDLRIEDF